MTGTSAHWTPETADRLIEAARRGLAVGRIHSHPIHPDDIIPGDTVLMVHDGRESVVKVVAVAPFTVFEGAVFHQKTGREWELIHRPTPPHPQSQVAL